MSSLPDTILDLLSDGPKKEMRLAGYTYCLELGLVRESRHKVKTAGAWIYSLWRIAEAKRT